MRLSIMILSCFISLVVIAQSGSTVNITVNGNRNREVRIDGTVYSVNANTSSTMSTNTPIQISNITPGQHSIEVVRTNRYNNTTRLRNKTTFTVRQGYDLDVTVNSDGSIQQSEKRIRRSGDYGYQNRYRNPMTNESFTTLRRDLRNIRGTNKRVTAISDAFNNTSNYFTTTQVGELISLVNSESGRLNLAKLSYRTITDPANFSNLNDLFNDDASINELETYVKNQDYNNPATGNGNRVNQGYTRTATSEASFTNLYNSISGQFGLGVKMSSLTNEFNNTNNYFTVAQARQLIQLVSDENNRLQLAKSSYDNVVDPENFTRMNDLFTSQSKRTELSDYVRNKTSYNQ